MTDADRKEIWLRRDEGVSMPDLAKRFNVSTTQIWRVCQERRIRTNVKTPVGETVTGEIESLADDFEKTGVDVLTSHGGPVTLPQKKRTRK